MNPKGKRKAKPLNRRLSNARTRSSQYVLQTSARTRFKKQQRRQKAVRFTLLATLTAATLAAAIYGARELVRSLFWNNPSYNIAEIRVLSDGPLPRERILNVAGLREGLNLFSVNLRDARERLAKLPEIREIEIQRDLSGCITIKIAERQPVAWIAPANDPQADAPGTEGQLLADASGAVFEPGAELRDLLHLPILRGIPPPHPQPGDVLASPQAAAALEIVRLSAHDTRLQIRSLDLSKSFRIVATNRRGARFTFAPDHLDQQMARLSRLLDHMEASGQSIATANLMVQRNIPVTFAPPPPTAPEPDAGEPRHPTAPATPRAKPVSSPKKARPTPGPSAASPPTDKPVRRALPAD